MSESSSNPAIDPANHFISQRIDADLAAGKHQHIVTRFPPEPNGYLHIGHAKSIHLNFGMAKRYQGQCNLRFDDTNPEKEDQEYVDAIKRDVEWLGFEWANELHASDYFQALYDYAEKLIENGQAYVDEQDADTIRAQRGTLTEAGQNSPYRERPTAESLDLLRRMKAGEFADGSKVLRAKIDMASPNINLRDPVIYRIKHLPHQRTGNAWCIYPMYDYTHCISDALEGITHSLCTLEFEDHRPLYDWVLDTLQTPCHPQQIEFSRLQLEYTISSKRKLNQLVVEGHVDGWDDPRMPTVSGMRRRGYTPEAIKDFCERIGITKKDGVVEMGVLENSLREDLNERAERRLAVIRPLKVTIRNYPAGQTEWLEAMNHPQKPELGTREIPFTREIYVEQDDFMEDAPRKFFRLSPGREVRLRFAYFITCEEVIKNEAGEVIELICSYDPETKGGNAPDGRKVKGTIHWVSAELNQSATVNLYDRLFQVANPAAAEDFISTLNPDSKTVLSHCKLETAINPCPNEDLPYQFERLGYFKADTHSSSAEPLFNQTIGLRDTWAKQK